MSETPISDSTPHNVADLGMQIRRLERQLNAANEQIQSLIEERDRANRLAEWKWNLRDEFELLLGTSNIEEGIEAVKELKRGIKRLEEALAWYESKVSDCNRQGPEGEAARYALGKDLGRKAKEDKL